MDPDDIVIDLGVRPRPGEQPPAGDPPPPRARIRVRPWLVLSCLAALLVLVAGSATIPGGPTGSSASGDPLPTTSSAPNLGQLNELDQQYRMYQHDPMVKVAPHGGHDAIQWCWIEQPQTGEMSLVPCAAATASPPPPDSRPGYPAGD